MNKHPITQRGADKLREEMRRLKSQDRPRVVKAIAEGDVRFSIELTADSTTSGPVSETESSPLPKDETKRHRFPRAPQVDRRDDQDRRPPA